EDSGAVTAESGWMPQHLVVEDEIGGISGCAPLYLKSHSYGEYVFDWAWAEAWDRAGGSYYPKLQSAVPFTPVTGPRLMVRPGATGPVREALVGGMVQLAERLEISSVHVTFANEDEWQLMGDIGFLQRIGQQFHWFNRDYGCFDDFLADLSSRKRKAIRKERHAVAEAEVDIRTLRGDEITEGHWDAFYRFYRDTSDRKWGPAYLNRRFFSELHASMGRDVVLIVAEREGTPIGGALNLVGGDALYGRYWGCLERYKFLHFEACYYRAIDFAIENGLKRVEAGAQGPHKVQRGYLPVPTYSAHWIADTGFRNAVARFIDEERRMVELESRGLTEASPFKKGGA
ncbi:MAG: GNAT family N-acetyltransferase, partial [Rhodospirillales bacterium]|nr:GNAT family N-acetyltransferase [Rhodospirillales bacterium]